MIVLSRAHVVTHEHVLPTGAADVRVPPGLAVPVRAYQWELTSRLARGTNAVVVAPTGSGKTLMSAIFVARVLRAARAAGVSEPKVKHRQSTAVVSWCPVYPGPGLMRPACVAGIAKLKRGAMLSCGFAILLTVYVPYVDRLRLVSATCDVQRQARIDGVSARGRDVPELMAMAERRAGPGPRQAVFVTRNREVVAQQRDELRRALGATARVDALPSTKT